MPSPIAHTAMGYIIHKVYQVGDALSSSPPLGGNEGGPGQSLGWLGPLPRLLLITAGVSLLPDLDSVAGILLRDFGRYHNNGSHSLFVGLAVALGIGGLVWWRKRSGFGYWFALILLCYQFHIILDFFTYGRGVMLFWPLSPARFASPIKLFYGLHWSDGFVSINHIWTLLNESGFVAVVVFVTHLLERKLKRFRPGQPSFTPEGISENQPPGEAPERG